MINDLRQVDAMIRRGLHNFRDSTYILDVFTEKFVSKLDRVASKLNMSPFGIHSLCRRPNVFGTSVDPRKIGFIR